MDCSWETKADFGVGMDSGWREAQFGEREGLGAGPTYCDGYTWTGGIAILPYVVSSPNLVKIAEYLI